ncbi:MAG: P-loop NTPase fold protein [Cyanobacteria bacterium P01_F01_bin.143]
MTSLASERATTLKTAYRICNVEPLQGADLDRYYVNLSEVRKTKAINSINGILNFQEPGEHKAILFTGHRGCGKSTELKLIQKKWETDYRVIYLEANEETDINDISFIDIYLIVIKKVEFELRKLGLKFDSELLKSFESWFKEITNETEKTVESSISIAGEASLGGGLPGIVPPFIAKLLVKLLAQIRGSQKQRKTIRENLEKDISRLQLDINLLLNDGLKKLRQKSPQCKDFLLIFDNLDRLNPKMSDRLFFDYAAQLQQLNCTIIYTVPIAAVYSPKNLNNNFGDPHIMPMINIYQSDRDRPELDYNQTNLDAVVDLIKRRVDIDAVFESSQDLRELAKASGGHVRQLMQMMRTACLTASSQGHSKIDAEDVIYAIKQEQFSFERFLLWEYYPILAKVYLSKDIDKDETGQLLMFNTSVLEYNGSDRWNYVNPLIKRINAFQKAVALLEAEGAEEAEGAAGAEEAEEV